MGEVRTEITLVNLVVQNDTNREYMPQDKDTDFENFVVVAGTNPEKYKPKWDTTGGKNGNGALSFTMPATKITDLDLAPYLTAPVTGGTAAGSVVGKEYIGTVEWSVTANSQTVALSGLFQANRVYTAKVTFYSLTGYTFAGVAANTFTHSTLIRPMPRGMRASRLW